MIDLHCHILHGLDDGPDSLDESLAMARRAVEDGVRAIVATPHTLNGIYINRVSEVTSRVTALQEILSENRIELQIYVGGDVHLCPHMLDRIDSGDAVTINDAKKFILLELPSQSIPEGVMEEVFSLKLNGITPIITHPERNSIIQHDPDIMHELVCMGALGQVTAMSLTGDFGEYTRQSSETLLKHRLVHVISSDAHSSVDRPPVLSQAVEQAAEILGDYEEAKRMVTEVPATILSGEMPHFPEPSPIKPKDRFFSKKH